MKTLTYPDENKLLWHVLLIEMGTIGAMAASVDTGGKVYFTMVCAYSIYKVTFMTVTVVSGAHIKRRLCSRSRM